MRQYRFVVADGDRFVSRHDYATTWRRGVTNTVPPPEAECVGLNSCRYISDAWSYVYGDVLLLVDCGGGRVRGGDKDTWERQTPLRAWRITPEVRERIGAAHYEGVRRWWDNCREHARRIDAAYDAYNPDDDRAHANFVRTIDSAKQWLRKADAQRRRELHNAMRKIICKPQNEVKDW